MGVNVKHIHKIIDDIKKKLISRDVIALYNHRGEKHMQKITWPKTLSCCRTILPTSLIKRNLDV
jgi:hypothetical protein